MILDTKQIVTVTEANQNFSRVAKLADRHGSAVIFKNSKPQYILINIDEEPYMELSHGEKVDVIARRVLKRYRAAFEELAK